MTDVTAPCTDRVLLKPLNGCGSHLTTNARRTEPSDRPLVDSDARRDAATTRKGCARVVCVWLQRLGCRARAPGCQHHHLGVLRRGQTSPPSEEVIPDVVCMSKQAARAAPACCRHRLRPISASISSALDGWSIASCGQPPRCRRRSADVMMVVMMMSARVEWVALCHGVGRQA